MDPFIFVWATEEPPLPPEPPTPKPPDDPVKRQAIVKRWLAHLRKKGATN
jgi:hypothetical protein